MKREIFITADGSTTIHLPDWNEQYHSKHGAIQEAYHVFIKMGLNLFEGEVSILEIGKCHNKSNIVLIFFLKNNCIVLFPIPLILSNEDNKYS